jgi:leader peptidase (prepilin peptidase)/N-methyltransferase
LISDSTLDFFQTNRLFLEAVAFLLGAVVGSFINVVSLRMPKMMEAHWRNQCCELLNLPPSSPEPAIFNLAFPASHCPQCQHAIRWWENIPVVSYLFLSGKCSSCKGHISIQYPLVEMLTALLTFAVIWRLGWGEQALAALLLTWGLVALSCIDYQTQLLPDDLTLPLLWCGLILNIFSVFTSLQNAVIGAVMGYLILWFIYWLYKLLTQKEGMGYGDFKLLAALGAWMGWQALPIIIIFSSLVGALTGVLLMILQRRDAQVPISFGPFLAAAGWMALLWGNDVTQWYFSVYPHR